MWFLWPNNGLLLSLRPMINILSCMPKCMRTPWRQHIWICLTNSCRISLWDAWSHGPSTNWWTQDPRPRLLSMEVQTWNIPMDRVAPPRAFSHHWNLRHFYIIVNDMPLKDLNHLTFCFLPNEKYPLTFWSVINLIWNFLNLIRTNGLQEMKIGQPWQRVRYCEQLTMHDNNIAADNTTLAAAPANRQVVCRMIDDLKFI